MKEVASTQRDDHEIVKRGNFNWKPIIRVILKV